MDNENEYLQIINELKIERERYKLLAEVTDCALWEYDPVKKSLNQSRKLNGRYADENLVINDYRNTVRGWNLIHKDDRDTFEKYCDSMDNGDDFFEYDLRSIGDNDEYIWMRFQGRTVRDSKGNIITVVGRTTDVSSEKQDRDELVRKSVIDPLTGLLNKGAVTDNVTRCLERDRDSMNELHAMMVIDIDDFKLINDRFGHMYGDSIIESFGKMLASLISQNDVIGRIGGDEFMIFMKNINRLPDVRGLAERIQKRVRNGLRGQKTGHKLTVSIGISFYPENGVNFDELYKTADMALYQAKTGGKDNYVIFNSESMLHEMNLKEESTEEHNWFRTPSLSYVENKLTSFALDTFSENKKVDSAIMTIFTELGKYYDYSRISIASTDENAIHAKIETIWCNDEPKAVISLEDINIAISHVFDAFCENMKESGLFCCSDTRNMPFRDEQVPYTKMLHTKAYLQCALVDEGKLYGIITFEDIKGPHEWNNAEISTLLTICRIINTFLVREKIRIAYDKEQFYVNAMISSQKLTNYAVSCDDYRMLYMSEYTGKEFPNVKAGDICFSALKGLERPCSNCLIKELERSGEATLTKDSYDPESQQWHNTTITKIKDNDNNQICLISQSDVTDFMEHVHSKDKLTGIPTFYKFELDYNHLLSDKCILEHTQYALIYTNISKFKYINDKWGYAAGDDLLMTIAGLMMTRIQKGEFCCRIAADQFAILFKYENMDILEKRLSEADTMITEEIKEKYHDLNLVLTSGIYVIKPEDKFLSTALDKATLAQKSVSDSHKSTFAVYDEKFHQRFTAEKEIELQMKGALEKKEFVVYLQPKVNTTDKSIEGAEALVRWNHNGKLIPPSNFIPVFERNGFIVELDFYMYEAVFSMIARWISQGKKPCKISVNVSRVHIQKSGFIPRLKRLIKKYGIPTGYVEFELTENMIYEDFDRFLAIINELRAEGFTVSIDDFGSGFSSLNMLKALPVDVMKLDKEFFLQNSMQARDQTVIAGIIQLGKGLGMKIVSEGVETEEQVSFLKTQDCDYIQGYYFYKPMPVDEFEKLI